MNTTKITSTKPYLLRAIFEWAEENGFTPQVLVNANAANVEVPVAHVVDDQIVLNIGTNAVQLHVMDNECLSFSARFSGVEQDIFLPIASIKAIFARENSQGIFFEEDEADSEPDFIREAPSEALEKEGDLATHPVKDDGFASAVKTPKPKPNKGDKKDKRKRDTSHLKIIK